jgi:hypothetical protein
LDSRFLSIGQIVKLASVMAQFSLLWLLSRAWASCLRDGCPECWRQTRSLLDCETSRTLLTHFQTDQANFVS